MHIYIYMWKFVHSRTVPALIRRRQLHQNLQRKDVVLKSLKIIPQQWRPQTAKKKRSSVVRFECIYMQIYIYIYNYIKNRTYIHIYIYIVIRAGIYTYTHQLYIYMYSILYIGYIIFWVFIVKGTKLYVYKSNCLHVYTYTCVSPYIYIYIWKTCLIHFNFYGLDQTNICTSVYISLNIYK